MAHPPHRRLRLRVRGSVQGVGFRPHVYRLAHELDLVGWVNNDPGGVTIEIEGDEERLEQFAERLSDERPAAAVLESIDREECAPCSDPSFRILVSATGGAKTAQVLPDIATCPDCERELNDPENRRQGYPFLNCTQCGPRFSIVQSLPYDRPRTTMSRFPMCEDCRREYDDPLDRRFHAQPTACRICGPRLRLADATGQPLGDERVALERACAALLDGKIVAVKGLGGFHLMLDARNGDAVDRLRATKPRRIKPLALMVRNLDCARELCVVEPDAALLLQSPEAPIVLLERRGDTVIDDGVAPDNPYLGLMLPHSPLHRLLLDGVDVPLVATSGNLSDEPICTDEIEAIDRLRGIADLFLVHDRPIARHVDDSVAWIEAGQPRLLRRARGYAPRPILLDEPLPVILAVGAHLKNSVALSVGTRVFVSQHIGDMETPDAIDAFDRVIRDFLTLYDVRPIAIAHDMHPDYASTRRALSWVEGADGDGNDPLGALAGVETIAVQHHHAHLASCLIEHGVHEPALGVIWDGTGYGTDGTIWGGEFLLGNAEDYRRVAHLRPFRLPGGDAAVREPRRSALALLWEALGVDTLQRSTLPTLTSFRPDELRLLAGMLENDIFSPRTSSMGRLFDAVASLGGWIQRSSFEGQAAMQVEHSIDVPLDEGYRFALRPSDASDATELDWQPVLLELLADLKRGVAPGRIAARFHHALVEALVDIARRCGAPTVVLSGGCFQNRRLVRHAVSRLRKEGFRPLLQCQVPPNDGGISLGQLAVASARLKRSSDGSARV